MLKKNVHRKIVLFVFVLVLIVVLCYAGLVFISKQKSKRLSHEFYITYNEIISYSDEDIDKLYLSAHNIEDPEAKYSSLWFVNTIEEGKDDVVIAVLEREDDGLNIYTCYVNPVGNYKLLWEKKEVKAADESLTTWLPKQMDKQKEFVTNAIRVDGLTDF